MAAASVLHEGLRSPYPDPEAGRKGRLLARILLAVSLAATAWLALRQVTGEATGREGPRPLIFSLGIDALLCISFLAPAKGTGGLPAHPRARWGITAIGVIVAALGALFFALAPGMGKGGVWRGDFVLFGAGAAVIAQAWKRPKPPRPGRRRR